MACPAAEPVRTVVVRWLTERDSPWLRRLIDEFEAHVGAPRRVLQGRLRGCTAGAHDPSARRVALAQLDQAFSSRVTAVIAPREARALLCRARAATQDPAMALREVAASLQISESALADALLGDLPEHRRLVAPPEAIQPARLALQCNLAMAQVWLRRSHRVEIELEGQARAIVRHAKLRGLLCTVVASGDGHPVRLVISGPFALFRYTTLYGRALAELLPMLAWARRYRMVAQCQVKGMPLQFVLDGREPLLPAAEPRWYDSHLEEQLARDLRRLAPDWEIVREPEPVRAGDSLVFPDFALQHRHQPARRFLLELAGYWTADYLTRKLTQLAAAQVGNLILCIDAARDCGMGDLPAHAFLVRYRRRPDAAAIVRILDSADACRGEQGLLRPF